MDKYLQMMIGLGNLGCYLYQADGHTWIEQDDNSEFSLHEILEKNHISLNNKIYGGVAQALLTVDFALRECGFDNGLLSFVSDDRLGSATVARDRIEKSEIGGLN